MRFINVALLFVFGMCCVFAQENTASDQEKRIQDLEKMILEQKKMVDQQQKLIQDLQKQVGNNQEDTKEYTEKIVREYLNQSAAEEGEGETIQAGYDNGFFIRSVDGNFKMTLRGYVQAGLGIFESDTTDDNSFFINGAQVNTDVYLYNQWHASLQLDFVQTRSKDDGFFNNGGDFKFEAKMEDAYVEYVGIDEFRVRVGQTHVPFTLEGQYGEFQGISIWQEPFIKSWAHGRDPGAMLYGTLLDAVEYKISMHNGEGQNRINNTDDFLYAGQLRVYYLGKSKHSDSFVHAGVIRGRDDRLKADGAFGSASIFSPWGRKIYGDGNIAQENSSATQGWRTAVDVGAKYQEKIGNDALRIEGEFMFSEWEREFAGGLRLTRLYGIGVSGGIQYRFNLTGNDDGSGIFPTIKYSYTHLDNYETNQDIGEIDGQIVSTYTIGLGYAFNNNVWVNLNYIILDVDRKDVDGPSENGRDASDDLEQAFFAQFTMLW